MSVIRVALIWERAPWMGAVNYYQSLASAIHQLPSKNIELILFAGKNVNTYDMGDYVQIVRVPILSRGSFTWVLWKLGVKLHHDILLYRLLLKHRVDVISHYPSLWKGCPIPSIRWIPDFQFLRLPHMFRQQDVEERVRDLKQVAKEERFVLLSSHDAENDFKNFLGVNKIVPDIKVLQFTTRVENRSGSTARCELISKYGLPEQWFYLPNQFWKHKNHSLVIEALASLKDHQSICVVATGKPEDFRNPEYYQQLMARVETLGVKQKFISLGEVPYQDVRGLMEHSVAVINPSLFEGWSTSVEESKALGKVVILSNIAVHQEQQPERGVFFSPDNATELASILSHVMGAYNASDENAKSLAARDDYLDQIKAFSLLYEKIIQDVTKQQ